MAPKDRYIGIMGTHGTGKTTLAQSLKQTGEIEFPSLRFVVVSEVARRCPFPINQYATEQSQEWIFHAQITQELHHRAWADIVISDRTSIDSLAYAEVHGFNDLVDACMPAALRHLETYDRIYFCRPFSDWLVDDGVRDTDPPFQKAVDECLEDWVSAYQLNVIQRRGPDGQ